MGVVTDGPLRLHFVWTGARFPYHCRLAVESALVSMPSAVVYVHLLGALPEGPHLRAVASHRRVVLRQIRAEEAFDRAPFGGSAYRTILDRVPGPAALSNLVRLAVLHDFGGVYLDTDVLVLRGLHDPRRHGAYIGQEWVWCSNRARIEGTWTWRERAAAVPWALRHELVHLDAAVARGRVRIADRIDPARFHRLQVNNAVIGAPPGAVAIEAALAAALEVDPTKRFALGPSLLDDVARAVPRSIHLLPPSRFYAVPPGQSIRCFHDRHLRLPPDAQVMHYVASNHRRLLTHLDIDDPRFAREGAPFWRRAAEVRAAIGEQRSRTRIPDPHLSSTG